jgi:hypothetical protein
MYTTCLFCNGDLGRNEVIEAFPVGRRLAFDAAKGRLWVVCRRCERWNLTPLEERWEAIEACEREFRATKLRVSTDEIGLARVREGLELLRIGAPQRPEMAAWRYGDQFGRRRRKRIAMLGGAAVLVGGVIVAGPVFGLIGGGAFQPVFNLLNAGNSIYKARKRLPVGLDDGTIVRVPLAKLGKVKLSTDGDEIVLGFSAATGRGNGPWWRFDKGELTHEVHGDAAVRAAGILLPHMNQGGGSTSDVSRAVGYLEEAGGDPSRVFRRAVGEMGTRESASVFSRGATNALSKLPTPGRLALEMAAHEDSERRALEGELHVLEAAWQAAEEIAGIADDMFLPASVDADLARLKKAREDGSSS